MSNEKKQESTCGCGGACGGHGSGARQAGGPARHTDGPAAKEKAAQGFADLSDGRLNLGLRASK
ncbi:MAG: hypothetical protein ACTHYA_09750 [Ancrocorticia populi]|nr:hypothetical protein [Ancrocorticia sp.]